MAGSNFSIRSACNSVSRKASIVVRLDFDIHYSNNMSEKDLRICKSRQKMAGGFRTEGGREMYCDITSCIEMMKRRGLNIY